MRLRLTAHVRNGSCTVETGRSGPTIRVEARCPDEPILCINLERDQALSAPLLFPPIACRPHHRISVTRLHAEALPDQLGLQRPAWGARGKLAIEASNNAKPANCPRGEVAMTEPGPAAAASAGPIP